MPTERKVAVLADLTDKMSRMQFAVIADYRGMTVSEMADLRTKMYESGAEVIIAKNTLLRMAARETGHEVLEPLFVGPTAITFAYDDIAKTAKAVEEYLKSAKIYTMRGGILGSTLIKPDEIEQVAKMPSRQEVLGQIVSGIQAPVAGLVGVVNAPASGVVGCVNSVVSNVLNVLQARINQLESQGQAS